MSNTVKLFIGFLTAVAITVGVHSQGVTGVFPEEEPVSGLEQESSLSAPHTSFRLPFTRVDWNPPPEISAVSAVLADVENGTAYYALRPRMQWTLASLTKLMASSIVNDSFDKDEVIALVSSDFRAGGNTFTESLEPGQRYTARDLFSLMMLSSSNEAAEAFARVYGTAGFVKEMNRRAAAWGLLHTSLVDPTGVAVANQSTAEDVKMMVLHLLDSYPNILDLTKNESMEIKELRSGKIWTVKSTHIFAGDPGFLGGKTGYIPEGGGNLVSLFSIGGRTVLVVVMGSDDRFGETSALVQWFIHDFSPSD